MHTLSWCAKQARIVKSGVVLGAPKTSWVAWFLCVWGPSGGPVAVQPDGFWWNKLGAPKTQLQDTLLSFGAPRAFAKDARVEFMKSVRKSQDGRRVSLPLISTCLRQDIEKQMRNLAASGMDLYDSAVL